MPLLSRASFVTGAGAVALAGLVGCFTDPPPAANDTDADDAGSEAGDADSTPDDGSDGGSATNPTSATGGGCMGCLDAAGGCLAGTLDQACGALAEACVACEGSTVCDQGTCVEPPACNPDTCGGCCDGDTCIEAQTDAACGLGGAQCAVCPEGSSCVQGTCELPCVERCDGCCQGETCIPLTDLSASTCGVDGDQCLPCPPENECSGGSCISSACASDCDGCCDGDTCLQGGSDASCGSGGLACFACPEGTSCGGTTCAADEDALWDFVVLSAEVPSFNANGAPWDLSSLPDPYVEVSYPGVSGETSAVDNAVLVEWDEAVLTGLTTQEILEMASIEFWDSDIGFDESMGSCGLPPDADAFGIVVTATCSDKNENLLWTLSFVVEASSGGE
ncbi:MAG: hypothetical protein AAGA54_13660 [Myxococcota bacterium]